MVSEGLQQPVWCGRGVKMHLEVGEINLSHTTTRMVIIKLTSMIKLVWRCIRHTVRQISQQDADRLLLPCWSADCGSGQIGRSPVHCRSLQTRWCLIDVEELSHDTVTASWPSRLTTTLPPSCRSAHPIAETNNRLLRQLPEIERFLRPEIERFLQPILSRTMSIYWHVQEAKLSLG